MKKSNRGAALLMTFVVMTILVAITVAFLFMTTIQTETSGYDISSQKALWIAQGGLRKYILRLRDETYNSGNIPNLNENLGDGSYAVTASYDGDTDTFTITSTGTVDVISRKIQQTLVETSATLARAAHADGSHLKLTGSSGTIDGNISCFVSVLPDPLPAGLTINGTVTDQDDGQVKVNPQIALGVGTTYYDLANDLGQVTTNKTFNSSGSPYTGIWYMTGWARIESNVTINGSIIAEGTITFQNSAANVVINPKAYDPTQNYPALVSGSDISSTGLGTPKIGLQNSAISGLILADNNLTFDYLQNTTSITGTILAGNNIEIEYGSVNVTYNEDIFAPMPPGFTYTAGGETTVIPQKDWNEIVPAT